VAVNAAGDEVAEAWEARVDAALAAITPARRQRMQKTWPLINVEQELLQVADWCKANPSQVDDPARALHGCLASKHDELLRGRKEAVTRKRGFAGPAPPQDRADEKPTRSGVVEARKPNADERKNVAGAWPRIRDQLIADFGEAIEANLDGSRCEGIGPNGVWLRMQTWFSACVIINNFGRTISELVGDLAGAGRPVPVYVADDDGPWYASAFALQDFNEHEAQEG
jgi:hypothetical protein